MKTIITFAFHDGGISKSEYTRNNDERQKTRWNCRGDSKRKINQIKDGHWKKEENIKKYNKNSTNFSRQVVTRSLRYYNVLIHNKVEFKKKKQYCHNCQKRCCGTNSKNDTKKLMIKIHVLLWNKKKTLYILYENKWLLLVALIFVILT